MSRKKVAIIQNRIQFGGRWQVTVHMIKCLNELGIVPDCLTFKSRFTVEDVAANYGLEGLQFRIREISRNWKVPFEWNILAFNRLVGKYLRDYDLAISNNNTSYMLKTDIPVLSYVHFPRKARMATPLESLHFPEGGNKRFLDIGKDPARVVAWLYRNRDKSLLPNDFQVANSAFTRDYLRESYGLTQEIPVIYPPVETRSMIEKAGGHPKKKNTVATLGRFNADKRQLEQIDIAAKLPEYRFGLIGFVNHPMYFEQCKRRIKENGQSNVDLHAGVSLDRRDELLSEAQYFMHNVRNEPFGITTVQAICGGAIPIVHDSGGQKEVVPFDELRFETVPEAVEKLKWLNTQSAEKLAEYRKALQAHVLQYDTTVFEADFLKLLKERFGL